MDLFIIFLLFLSTYLAIKAALLKEYFIFLKEAS